MGTKQSRFLQSGQAVRLDVKHNAVLGDLAGKPQSVTLKNAASETIRSTR